MNSVHVCSIYTAWSESSVEAKASMDEKTEQNCSEQGSISMAVPECMVNLANLYKLTRVDDGFHFPLLRTKVFQKQ